MTTTMTLEKTKVLFLALFLLCLAPVLLAGEASSDGKSSVDQWVLAARKFDVSRTKKLTKEDENLSRVVPSLILSQVQKNLGRNVGEDEHMRRWMEDSLSSRLALYLQLSAEVKKRDSLAVTYETKRVYKKKKREYEKKINEIREKIGKNLEDERRVRLEHEGILEIGPSGEKMSVRPMGMLRDFFRNGKDGFSETYERIAIYRDDVSVCFEASDPVVDSDVASTLYERQVIKEKINAVITGKINLVDGYAMISADVRLFPGNIVAGSVAEVGSVQNIVDVSNRLAQKITPLITDSLPLDLYFDIKPDEVKKSAKVTIDGNAYSSVPEKVVLNAGSHSFSIEAEDFAPLSLSYDFHGSTEFVLHAELEEKRNVITELVFSKPVPAEIVVDGRFGGRTAFGKPGIFLSGEPHFIMGQYRSLDLKTKEGEPRSFFFYVPGKYQETDATLKVPGKVLDSTAYINKRRIMAYTSYTLLVLSMVPTLYTMGKYVSTVNSYNSGTMNDLDEVKMWQRAEYISAGISAGCALVFAFELFRYLKAADSVLPKKAVKATAKSVMKAEQKSMKYFGDRGKVRKKPEKKKAGNVPESNEEEKTENNTEE